MNYKYHHKILDLMYISKELEPDNARYEFIKGAFSAESMSKRLKIKDIGLCRSILTNLREDKCLASKFSDSDRRVYFFISDIGVSKYFEQYYVNKRKIENRQNLIDISKFLFYLISTVGILTSIYYNIYSTKIIIEDIKELKKQEIIQPTFSTQK